MLSVAPCSGTTMIDDRHPQHLHEYVHSQGCYSCITQRLVTLGGPERWMHHIAGVFCLRGGFVDMLGSVPDLSVVSSTTGRATLSLVSGDSQCPRRVASHAVQIVEGCSSD